MKVILLADVKNLGKKDQIVTVSDGYAMNYLLPRKLAVQVTATSQAILNQQNAEREQAFNQNKANALEDAKKLVNIVLEFKAKASPDGRMTGTISPVQIEKKLFDEHAIKIDKRKFIDKYPVNAFGTSRLKIELFKGVIATVNVHVSEEK